MYKILGCIPTAGHEVMIEYVQHLLVDVPRANAGIIHVDYYNILLQQYYMGLGMSSPLV